MGDQGGCERRIEVIVEMKKKSGGGGSGPTGDGGSRGGGWSIGRGLVGSNVGVGVIWGMGM